MGVKKDRGNVPTKDSNKEVNSTDQETPIAVEDHVEEPREIVPFPQPPKAPSQALRPTLRRDRAYTLDRDITVYTIRRDLILLKIFTWVTAILCVLAKAAVSIFLVLFIAFCLNWRKGREWTTALVTFCGQPTQQSYSALRDAMFPSSESDKSYQMTFKVTESNYVSAAVLFEVTYPLLLKNPAVTLLITFSMFITYHLLSFVHHFLLEVTGVMDAELLDRTAPQEPVDQPQLV